MDCTWPLPYAIPNKAPDWSLLKSQVKNCTEEQSVSAYAALDRMCDLRRRIAEFLTGISKSPGTVAQPSFVDGVLRPYVYLVSMASQRFDFSSLTASSKKPSVWKTAWDDAWTGKTRTFESQPLAEAFLALHCAAAALTSIGSQSVASGTVDGYKTGFQAFQQAAGMFDLLLELAPRHLTEALCVGMFAADMLHFSRTVCLANASHCFLLRAESEMATKRITLSKLCIDAAAAYEPVSAPSPPLSLPLAENSAVALELQHAKAAKAVIRARAHRYAATQYFEDQDMGLAISHLNAAQALLNIWTPKEATEKALRVLVDWTRHELFLVEELLSKAVQRNDTVYFAKVPATTPTLEAFGKPKGAPVRVPGLHAICADQSDPFEGIVPRDVQEKATEFKRSLFEQLKQKTQEVLSSREWASEQFSTLGVSGAIQTLSSDPAVACRIPEGIRAKLLAMRRDENVKSSGSLISHLVGHVSHTQAVADSVKDLIREATDYVHSEKEQDDRFVKDYGERVWRPLRTASGDLPEAFRILRVAKELQSRLSGTVVAPLNQLKSLLDSNAQGLARLDWPLNDLDALMPSPKTAEAAGSRADIQGTVEQLRNLAARLDQNTGVETTRLKAVQELISSDRIINSLLGASGGRIPEVLRELQAEVDDHYSVVQTALASRRGIVQEAEAAMLDLAARRSLDPVALEIQEICTSIERAIVMYESAIAQVGALANTATVVLEEATQLRDAARDFFQARSMEAQDVCVNLDREISARMATMQAEQSIIDASIAESRKRQAQLQAELEELERQQFRRSSQSSTEVSKNTPLGATTIVSYDYPGAGVAPVAPYPMYGVPSGPPPLPPNAQPPPPPPGPPPPDDGSDAFAAFFRS